MPPGPHHRTDGEKQIMIEKLTPTETVLAYCVHCLGMYQYNSDDIRSYQGDQAFAEPCPFFPYRMGTNPARQGIGGNIGQVARELMNNHQESIFPGQSIGKAMSIEKRPK